MFWFLSRKRPDEYRQSFVKEVHVSNVPVRDRKFERLLWLFWAVILAKCAFIWWLMRHYRIPFHPLWVVAPTLAFAGLIHLVYIWRD